MAIIFIAVLLLMTSCCALSKPGDERRVNGGLVEQLFGIVQGEQTQEDVPFVEFIRWFQSKGVYQSEVKLNFHGKSDMTAARHLVGVFDNNMFVTAWVTSTLLEAFKYGQAPRPSDHQLSLALQVFTNHTEKNKPYNSSVRSFWPQAFNQTVRYWQSTPVNLLGAFKSAEDVPLPLIEAFLKMIGLGDVAKDIEKIMNDKYIHLQAFHIPPDFDDTFVNIGLGSLLFSMRSEFPQGWQLWHQQNTNISSVFDALKKYAYRPFSKDPNVNSIDPRTYMYIRGFLNQAHAKGENVALVTTWVQNLADLRREYDLGVGMPFQINNVDITVAANSVYGITAAILSGLVPPSVLEDKEIAQIYLNTSSLIAFQMSTNYSGRPDLALTYYPSVFDFSWFVARTVNILEEARDEGTLPNPIMEASYQLLKRAIQGPVTRYMLSAAKHEGDLSYFDDFLGDGDVDSSNNTVIRGEDRIFSTAMATNALIYTWTKFNITTKMSSWRTETPQTVKTLVKSTVAWLSQHALDPDLKPWNAFFSGSEKGDSCLPFWYPANRCEFVNGTKISDCSFFPESREPFLIAMQGYVSAVEYDAMLRQKHFRQNTPLTFPGYNADPGFFPIWSSMSYTHVTSMLALARHNTINI